MAKSKKSQIIDRYAQGMYVRQDVYAMRVKSLYDYAVDRLLALANQIPDLDTGHKFSFSDNPRVAEETTLIIRQLNAEVYKAIKEGVQAEWEYANLSCDKMIQSAFGWKLKDKNVYAKWFDRNEKAMNSFFARKSSNGGLNLSQKVWKYTGSLRQEMENCIIVALGEGKSAAEMSKAVRQYLQYPDKLFRRVRGSDGKLHLSANAKAFHPSRGVYRSSYKNAMRLTRSETNMAYVAADQDRWQRMDFVVGYEVKKSNNHPDPDICDDLAGKYPKDFKFYPWHPQCRCHVIPILASESEMVNMQKVILKGGDPKNVLVRKPEYDGMNKLDQWVGNNYDRIKRASVKPYFIQHNYKYGNIDKGLKFKTGKSVAQIAEDRHAQRDAKSIQNAWNQHKIDQLQKKIRANDLEVNESLSGRMDALHGAVNSGDLQKIEKAFQRAAQGVETQIKWDKLVWEGFSPEQKIEMRKLGEAVGVKKGRPMDHAHADSGLVNPLYKNPKNEGLQRWILNKTHTKYIKNPLWDDQYSINCQTCAPTYMLRRWGFNVEALGNIEKDPVRNVWKYLNHNWTNVWINKTGEKGFGRRFRSFTDRDKLFATMSKQEDGIYQVECTWKGGKSGHTWNFVKENGECYMYDPQSNKTWKTAEAFKEYTDSMSVKWKPSFFRIDDLRPNTNALKHIIQKETHVETRAEKIRRIAAERHAKRDDQAIQKLWDDRKKKNALIEKTARNVLRRSRDFVETYNQGDELIRLIKKKNWIAVDKKMRSLANEISVIYKDERRMKKLIPDVHELKSRFSTEQLHKAYDAIEKTFNRWTWDLDSDASLQFLQGRLKREIGVVERSLHTTKEVAKAAFEKRLGIVERKIEINTIKKDLDHEFQFALKSRSKVVKNLVSEIKTMMNDDSADVAEIRMKQKSLKDKVKKLEGRSKPKPVVSTGTMTDDQIKNAMVDYYKQHGRRLDRSSIVIKDGCVHITSTQHNEIWEMADITSSEYTRIWRNGNGGYIQTSNSFTINGALRDVGGKGKYPITGDVATSKNRSLATDMYGKKLKPDDLKTIAALDEVVGRNTLPFPIKTVRNVNFNGVNPLFGGMLQDSNLEDVVRQINGLADKTIKSDFGFMSTSSNAMDNVFKSRRYQLQIEVPQGHSVFVTKNTMESEVILGRETKLKFLSAEYDQRQKIAIIRVIAV